MIIRDGFALDADAVMRRIDFLCRRRFGDDDPLTQEYINHVRPVLWHNISTDANLLQRFRELSDEELTTEIYREVSAKHIGVSPGIHFVSIGIIVFCCIMFGIELLLGGGSVTIPVLTTLGGRVNLLIQHGQLWRLVMAIFLHGGIVHLICNMLVLYNLGELTEMLCGHLKFAIIFLLAGLAGNFAGFAFSADNVVSIGASGAIFGLFGALIAFRVRYGKQRFGLFIDDAAFLQTIGMNLIIGLVLFFMIDNFAHVGGLIGGYFAAEIVGFHRDSLRLRNLIFLAIYTVMMLIMFVIGFVA